MLRPLAILLLLVSPLRAEWRYFAPTDSLVGQGILRDVVSHCDEAGRRTAYEPDYVTYCHEATHLVNSRVRQLIGGTRNNAFYTGDHHVCILAEPNIRLSAVARYVDQSLRNSTYQLYFVDQQKYWDDCPLYVLDEWVSYLNGLQAAQELQIDGHGERDRAIWFAHYADSLVAAVKDGDPNYGQLADLIAFVAHQKQRLNIMSGQAETVAQQCCTGGNCQQWRPPTQVIVKPVIKPLGSQQLPPPPQPLNPPLAQPPAQPSIDWAAKYEKLESDVAALHVTLEALKSQVANYKECQCGDHAAEVDAKITAAIAAIHLPQPPKPEPPNYDVIAAEVGKRLPPINMRVAPQAPYQSVKLGSYVTLPLDKHTP